MEIVTLREFARRIGVSLTAIQKGIKTGRLAAITDAETGRIKGIDYSTQAQAWEDNCKAPQRRAHNPAGGRPRKDGTPAAAPGKAIEPKHGDVLTHLEGQPHGGALKRNQKQDVPGPGGRTLSELQRDRESVKLRLDELKLKEAEHELLPRAEQEKVGYELGSGLISDLYNLPERLSDELAGMTDPNAIHRLITVEIDSMVGQIREKLLNATTVH